MMIIPMEIVVLLLPLLGFVNCQTGYNPRRSIDYKETHICETTPGVKSYAGYVHLPASSYSINATDSNYTTSTFFWYFESRHAPENAPLIVYLGGGPGESSLWGATLENGPCYVTDDSNDTYTNPWSFNNFANVLYIDQPVFAGFSYDNEVLTNASYNLITGETGACEGSCNGSFAFGRFGSQNMNHTSSTTKGAARVLWEVLQAWFDEFHHDRPNARKMSLISTSYGGYYGPGMFNYFLDRNEHEPAERQLKLQSLIITNGCIDAQYSAMSYPQFAHNNTYDVQFVNQTVVDEAQERMPEMSRLLDECRSLAQRHDPEELGTNEQVNSACSNASKYYGEHYFGVLSKYSPETATHDIAQKNPANYPPHYTTGFMQQQWVQQELGVPVNFSDYGYAAAVAFSLTSDAVRQEGVKHLARILNAGISIALVYGDRDLVCNWFAAETISLSTPWQHQDTFTQAGYTSLQTNSTYTGGLVRQSGRFSFSRIFHAAHSAGYDQPETIYEIARRTILGFDVAQGQTSVDDQYATTGEMSTLNIREKLPPPNPIVCYQWLLWTCTQEQVKAVENGTAVIRDYIVVWPAPLDRSYINEMKAFS